MLSKPQTATLHAAIDRIVPADEWPGGWDAGVGDYLDRQFARDLADRVETYRRGLDALDAEAQASAGSGFAALSPDMQDRLLAQVEAGETGTPWAVDPAYFFRMLVDHTMEGYYADPGNGGNRDGVSWRMIGFEVRG